MTAETDLPPVPVIRDTWDLEEWRDACVSSATEAARANLAELQREVEGLRAEVERLEIAGRLHSGTADLAINAVRAAEARAERLAEALRLISKQGTHYGPDGTRESWQYWAEIARAALEQENDDAN